MPEADPSRVERDARQVAVAVVDGLDERVDAIVESVIAQVRRDVPEYRPPGADPALVEGVEQTVRRSVQMVLRLWREGKRNLTTGDRVVMGMIGSQRAEQGVALDSLLSSVRIARSVGWSHAVSVAEKLEAGPETVAVLGDLASVLFDIADDVCDAITAGYDRVQEHRLKARERTRSQVFEDLLGGSFADDDMVIRARTFGFDLRRPHGLLLLTTIRPEQDRSVLRAAVAALLPSIGNAAEVAVSADVAPHMVLVVPSSGSTSWDEVIEATQRVARQHRVTVVVSAPVAGARAIHAAYRRAGELLPLAITVFRRPHVSEAGDLVVYQILRGSKEEDRADFLERTLGPILHLPEVQRAPLLDTLDALHEGSGHTETAAAMLGVHTNTVRYRIGRIHHLTGLRYDHPPDRFKLEVAPSLLRMAGGPGGPDRSAMPQA
jgi:DNA-binding PucR family transcriptional regulator